MTEKEFDSLVDGKQRFPGTNVIFAPQFGIANVYVAGLLDDKWAYDWAQPPRVSDLEPLVNSIVHQYVEGWSEPPVGEILVRVPVAEGVDSVGSFGVTKYKVVSKDYIPDPSRNECGASGSEPCTLAAQLIEVGELENRVLGSGSGARWSYRAAEQRIQEWKSPNSGDIVLFANAPAGYQFGHGYRANHGSLTPADALVPVAFGYPGASGSPDEDDTLRRVFELLASELSRDPPQPKRLEALALERFFGLLEPANP